MIEAAGEPEIAEITTMSEFQAFTQQPGVRAIKYYLKDCGPCRLLSPTFKKIVQHTSIAGAQLLLNKFKKADFPHIDKAPLVEVWKDGEIFCHFSGTHLSYARMSMGVIKALSSSSSEKEESSHGESH